MARVKQVARKMKRGRKPKRKRYKKKLALQSHNFVERVEDEIALNASTLDSQGHLSTMYAKQFRLNDIPQVASYKELFDDYVLNKVVAEIRYDTFVSDNTYTNQSNPVYPQLLIKTDHNDVSTQTWNQLKESEKSRLIQLRPAGRPISHVIKPSVQIEMYRTALTSGYGSKWGQIVRTDDSELPHYGLKIQVKTQPGDSDINLGKISIMYKYYFTMKNSE